MADGSSCLHSELSGPPPLSFCVSSCTQCMNSKPLMILLLVMAAAIGFSLSHFRAAYFARKQLENVRTVREAEQKEQIAANDPKALQAYFKQLEPSLIETSYEFSRTLGILQAMRTGDTTDTIRELEGDLEVNVAVLAAAIEELPAGRESSKYAKLVRAFCDYRLAHPRGSNESLLSEEEITHIFSLVSTNSQ